LLAGTQFQTAEIFEAGPPEAVNHKAVLRFRTSAVSDAVGIPFRRVTVHKGIWLDGKYMDPTIQLANWYSKKVIGRLSDRSIWNLAPAERFIAPADFQAQLASYCNGRIHFNHTVSQDDFEGTAFLQGSRKFKMAEDCIISTLPMPVMMKMAKFGYREDKIPEFKSVSIDVRRWHVPDADVFQTVYFPNEQTQLYRASITGDLLIAEYVNTKNMQPRDVSEPFEAFGLYESDCKEIERPTYQRYGKIAPIDDGWRKSFMFNLTEKYNIFSLGRFATWRNILLDDVVHDIIVIKQLMTAGIYDRARAHVNL
jgi:hypothetical protein